MENNIEKKIQKLNDLLADAGGEMLDALEGKLLKGNKDPYCEAKYRVARDKYLNLADKIKALKDELASKQLEIESWKDK